LRGLLGGRRSSRYPQRSEQTPGITPGRPAPTALPEEEAKRTAAACPTAALAAGANGLHVDYELCVHCQRCRCGEMPARWENTYEWAVEPTTHLGRPSRIFRRSLHVRLVDAGACGACMGEASLLDSPPYNFHRLGIFYTPTPRTADVLLIAGPVSENMRAALASTYAALPTPKRVVAMGVCAINGGVFGAGFASAGGAQAVVPVDVVIPGCPPPPLAIIHGLLLATGRAASSTLEAG
jgi:Ni,Fe-hydrogenase III small subunit/ferredoxin-like protein FixX